MKFTAFSEDNGKYSYLDLYYYQFLNILTFQKVKKLQKKRDTVKAYIHNLKRVY